MRLGQKSRARAFAAQRTGKGQAEKETKATRAFLVQSAIIHKTGYSAIASSHLPRTITGLTRVSGIFEMLVIALLTDILNLETFFSMLKSDPCQNCLDRRFSKGEPIY